MRIKWLGHAAFLITSDTGVRIITDPYTPTKELGYDRINETADIVTVSHDHFDHNNVAAVSGDPEVVTETAEVKGIKFRGVFTHHDEFQGAKRGRNTVFCFELDGIKVCHLGDLGHLLDERQAAEIGKVDVLLVPVGGFFTIDAPAAGRVSNQLKPKVMIPMHFKTGKCGDLPISGVDAFLQGESSIVRMDASEVELKPGELRPSSQIIVLKPAR